MDQPEGFEQNNGCHCLVTASLYGARQAPRCFNADIDAFLKSLGFTPFQSDRCVYVLRLSDHLIYVWLFVDDLVYASSGARIRVWFEKAMVVKYDLKLLGVLTNILGMRVTRTSTTLKIDLENYTNSVLSRFSMEQSRPTSTPGAQGVKLSKQDCPKEGEPKPAFPYREVVGSVSYLAQATRPDISYQVSQLAKFCNNYGEPHCRAAKHLLRFLVGTADLGIVFDLEAKNTDFHVFTDSDHAGCPDTGRSTTSFVNLLMGAPVAWLTRRQASVTLSTMAAEVTAITEAVKQILYGRQFMADAGVPLKSTTIVFCDNQASISFAKHDGHHSRTKHIAVRVFFLREQIAAKVISLRWISTQTNVADILTKTVTKAVYLVLTKLLGLR